MALRAQTTTTRLPFSALLRCLQHHGSTKVSAAYFSEDGQSPPKKKFKDYPMGCLHVDFAEVRTEKIHQFLLVATDRACKVVFAELHRLAKRVVAGNIFAAGTG